MKTLLYANRAEPKSISGDFDTTASSGWGYY